MTSGTTTSAPTGAPADLTDGWESAGDPRAFAVTRDAARVTAPAGADLFHAPGGHRPSGVPALRRPLTGDFTVSTRVAVTGGEFADAGGLSLHGPDGWFKLCLERTRAGGWAAVTVLTRPYSDEAFGPALPGPEAELLLTREGRRTAAFVRTEQDRDWQFVRTFTGWDAPWLTLGLFAQAPFSRTCAATFTPPLIGGRALRDRR